MAQDLGAHDAATASSEEPNPPDAEPSTDAYEVEAQGDSAPQPTVWIGETDTTVTVPGADYDGGDIFYFGENPTSSLPNSPPEKVVLILNQLSGSVTGTITFGKDRPPPPPTDPKKPYPPPTLDRLPDGATKPIGFPWVSDIYPGFSYSLVSSYVSGNVLNLTFVPSEVYRGWCALQDPAVGPPDPSFSAPFPPFTGECDCEGGACRSASGPIDRIDLAINGSAMQGQLLDNPLYGFTLTSSPVAIRLLRVQ